MDKSTKEIVFSLFGPFGLIKFSHQSLRWGWGGCEKSHLNQKCRKFHEMDKYTKKIFFTVWTDLDLENFLIKVCGGGGGGVVKNHTWTKNAGNFMKWINPQNFFFTVWPLWSWKIFSWEFEVVVVGQGCLVPDSPTTTTPKLNSTFLDLEKWLFMSEICDDILLLPVGNYSFVFHFSFTRCSCLLSI